MKVNKLSQHKTRAVLFRIAQPLGTKVCINKLLEFTSNSDYSICKLVSKANPTDFYVSVRPNGVADLWLNGKNIAIMYPEGSEGWKVTTYDRLKQTFPHEHRMAVAFGVVPATVRLQEV